MKAAHLCAEAALRLVKPGNQVKFSHHYGSDLTNSITVYTTSTNCHHVVFLSEHTGHRSLEQDRKVIQVLPYRGCVFNIWHFQDLWSGWYTFAECNLTCSVYSFNVCRHAVPSTQTTCDRRGENYHPKPNGPAKVGSPSKWLLSLTLSVPLHQWMTMSLCFCRKDHEKAEFEVHEVYAVDVLISTGEGKVRGSVVLIQIFHIGLKIP